MYNIVLHEMAHVFLLDHGEYRDSLSGYLLRVMPTGGIVQATERIKMTEDDCYGIYIKMINAIIMSDYTYAIHLNNLMQSQCKNTKLIPCLQYLPRHQCLGQVFHTGVVLIITI